MKKRLLDISKNLISYLKTLNFRTKSICWLCQSDCFRSKSQETKIRTIKSIAFLNQMQLQIKIFQIVCMSGR